MLVSALAESMPANKIGLRTGQLWSYHDLMATLLLSSANDSAVALAEHLGGTRDGFSRLVAQTSARMGMEDGMRFSDPAGLDDEFANPPGNLVSARDLAIASINLLSRPDLAALVKTQKYHFVGGDGINHSLTNHNKLLFRDPDAVGMKTGYTHLAGKCLIAAVNKNGRLLVAVVLDAGDTYSAVEDLFAQAAFSPIGKSNDRLPAVVAPAQFSRPISSSSPSSSSITVPSVTTLLTMSDSATDQKASETARPHGILYFAGAITGVGILVLGASHIRRRPN